MLCFVPLALVVRTKKFNYITSCVTRVRYFRLEETFSLLNQGKLLVIYLFKKNWIEFAMKFLMAQVSFYQRSHFPLGIFEIGFMQYISRSSAGRLFILISVDEENTSILHIPIRIFGKVPKQFSFALLKNLVSK